MKSRSRRHLRKARGFVPGLFLLLVACDASITGFPEGTQVFITTDVEEARTFQRACLDTNPRHVVTVSFGGVKAEGTSLEQPGYYLVCYRMPHP